MICLKYFPTAHIALKITSLGQQIGTVKGTCFVDVQNISAVHNYFFHTSMNQLISQFENIQLNDTLNVKYLKRDPLNTQTCFVSNNVFESLSILPGSIVLLVENSHTFICKIYAKMLLADYIIELDKSVYLLNSKFDNGSPEFKINKNCIKTNSKPRALKEIHVEIIFETFQDMLLSHGSEKELCDFLKNYLLTLLIIINRCHINLDNFFSYQKFGIYEMIIHMNNENPDIQVGMISENTKIAIKNISYKEKYKLENSILPPLYEMDCHVERLMEIININRLFSTKYSDLPLQPSKQILLVGPTGCGKSSIVSLIAQKCRCSIFSIYDHAISQKEPGETESTIRDIFDQAFACAKITGQCIINLEEIGNLCPKRKNSSSHVQRAATQILLLLDKAQEIPGIIVIATTNKPDQLDTSLRRHGRLETEIYIAPPTEIQRQVILENLITELNLGLSTNNTSKLSQSLASMTPGYVGADLKQICQKIKCTHKTFEVEDNTLEFWTNEFRRVVSTMKPASLHGTLGSVTIGHVTFDDLAGLEDIKKSLEMAVLWPLTHAQAFARMGITRPKGVLLYGPPGCAKTSLIRALACLGTFSLLSISAAELYSPFVGDAERLIVKLFERARQNSPCLIFIDEIDALAGSRGASKETNSDVQERILASLLTQMDGIGNRSDVADWSKCVNIDDGVIVIGATNRPDMIDPALLRPGRFDKHILVPPPNEEGRLSILKLITKKMPTAEDINLGDVASKTEYYSGADMKNICAEAALIALSEDGMDVETITNNHFKKALSTTRPSLNKSQIMKYYKAVF